MRGLWSLRCLPFIILCALPLRAESAPLVIAAGTLDLTDWHPDDNPILRLDGAWRFEQNSLANPAGPIAAQTYLNVPGFWNDQKIPPQGYATYALQIRRKPGREEFAVHVVDMESAYALYANGTLIGSNGRVGKSAAEELPEWKPAVWPLTADGDIRLVLHVSNFHHRLGGVWQGLRFGKAETIRKLQTRSIALELFLFGSFLMIAVYHILIFLLRRNEREFLYLGLFCLLIGLRSLVTGERFILHMIPSLDWIWLVRLDYLTSAVPLIVAHWYLSRVFTAYYYRPLLYAVTGIMGLCVVAELILPVKIFSYLTPVHSLAVVLWSAYFLIVNIVAVVRKMPGARVLLAGWLIAVAGMVNDTLYIHAAANSGYFFAAGLYALILSQSYYLAMRYARAFSLSELLGKRMESLLRLTRDLNRSGKRDSAIWTAVAEIRRVAGADIHPIVYARSLAADPFERLSPEGEREPLTGEISRALQELDSATAAADSIRFPARSGGATLCVLEIPALDEDPTGRLQELSYIQGILDSLGTVLESMRKVEREALATVGQAAAEIVHDINHHGQIISYHARTAAKNRNAGMALENIEREVLFMRNLALDILDYAREQLVIYPKPIAVDIILDTIRATLTELFRDSKIRFSVDQVTGKAVHIDLERFRRVVTNLARNAAAAMAGDGEFHVRCEIRADACSFVFEDTGPGLDPKIRDRLFGPLPADRTEKTPALGFGLAVVKRIVIAHGGNIMVHSEPNKGSRFLIELPIGKA